MRSLWLLTTKNLRLLFRSKGSSLIIIFALLLLILILGLSYNGESEFGLSIGVHSPSFTDDVNSFVKLLEDDGFSVTKYENSIETCIDDIKTSSIHSCVLLPESLSIEDNNQKEVKFYIDPTRVNLVWMIQETVQEKFNLKSQQISQDLTGSILSTLSETKSNIGERKNEATTLKDKSSTASSSTSSVKGTLEGLDLVPPPAIYDTASLSNITNELSTASTEIEEAIDKVDDSALNSSEKSSVKSALTSAKTTITSAKTAVDGSLGGLVADLDSAKAKLAAASAAVTGATTNLGAANTNLQESLSTIDTLISKLDEMINKIDSLKVTEAGTIASPFVTSIEMVREEGSFLNYLFPSLLIIVMMFSSLLLGTSLVMMEKTSPAFVRNFFLPIRKVAFITSIYLTNAVLILLEITVLLGISLIFLPELLSSLGVVILVLFITGSTFAFLGMILGYIFTTEETSVLASVSLGSLLLFFSGVVLPLEGIPLAIRQITFFNPFVIAEKLVRESFFFSATIPDLWFELVLLLGYMLTLFIIIWFMESVMHKHLVHRFLRHHHRAHKQKDKKSKKDA